MLKFGKSIKRNAILRQKGRAAFAAESGDTLELAKPCEVAVLTGGDDKPYALGLAAALLDQGVLLDFIGSDSVDGPELHNNPMVNFLNLRGSQREDVGFARKLLRVLAYYIRLIRYAACARAPIFHILWNNKFELIDRVFLMLLYRALGKKVLLTAHNVNAKKRDGGDNLSNRTTLWIQYHLCHAVFVHTRSSCEELANSFGLSTERIHVIPFGLNDTIPRSGVTKDESRRVIGVPENVPLLLAFGQIAPYKGLEYLAEAMNLLRLRRKQIHLIVAGKVKRGCEGYWEEVKKQIQQGAAKDSVTLVIRFIPDQEVERYFCAADAAVLSYTAIYQSGVPFLSFSFGLPIIATDVGELAEEVKEAENGFVCRPRDAKHLAEKIEHFTSSTLFANLESLRPEIRRSANERHSWAAVGAITRRVYGEVLKGK